MNLRSFPFSVESNRGWMNAICQRALIWGLALIAGVGTASVGAADQDELFDAMALKKNVQPFLKQHCFACHGPDKQKGKLRLDQLVADFTDSAIAEKWIEVMDNINLGEMPPEDEPGSTGE